MKTKKKIIITITHAEFIQNVFILIAVVSLIWHDENPNAFFNDLQLYQWISFSSLIYSMIDKWEMTTWNKWKQETKHKKILLVSTFHSTWYYYSSFFLSLSIFCYERFNNEIRNEEKKNWLNDTNFWKSLYRFELIIFLWRTLFKAWLNYWIYLCTVVCNIFIDNDLISFHSWVLFLFVFWNFERL